MARLERAQRLGPGGVHRMPRMTRARAAVGEALMIGVVALFCAASMLGSQFRGPRWRHLFGIDVNPKFGPSFSLNNDGAPLLAMDILTLSVDDFDKLLASYAPGDMKYLLLVVTLDCGRASKANRTATNEEKRKFYMAAVAKVEELTKAAERKYNVFLFWEFVNCGFVLDLVEETFPEIDMITLEGHLFEDRERVFMSQRLDKGMELFEEELDSLVEAAGGESCAAAGLEGVRTRLVSMPSWELFDKQSLEYQLEVRWAALHSGCCGRVPNALTPGAVPRHRPSRAACRCSPSRLRRPRGGASTRTACSACGRLAHRVRPRRCSSTSASPSRTSRRRHASCSSTTEGATSPPSSTAPTSPRCRESAWKNAGREGGRGVVVVVGRELEGLWDT